MVGTMAALAVVPAGLASEPMVGTMATLAVVPAGLAAEPMVGAVLTLVLQRSTTPDLRHTQHRTCLVRECCES